MRTLIVPCAGKSTRFPNMKPKWMLYYPDNKMMLEKAVEGLDTNEYDRIIFTVVREHVEKYAAKDVIEEIFSQRLGEKMQICVLEDFTSCQAETVYLTLKQCNVEGCFEVKDSDNYICIGKRNNPEFVAGVNVSTFPKEINRLAAKSFLVLNEQNIITDIVEKRIRSEYISVGLYGFKDVRTFSDAYMHLRDVSESNYEIYLSHIISYLIGTQASVYSYEEAIEYEDWGTLTDWNNTLCEKKTYSG